MKMNGLIGLPVALVLLLSNPAAHADEGRDFVAAFAAALAVGAGQQLGVGLLFGIGHTLGK